MGGKCQGNLVWLSWAENENKGMFEDFEKNIHDWQFHKTDIIIIKYYAVEILTPKCLKHTDLTTAKNEVQHERRF